MRDVARLAIVGDVVLTAPLSDAGAADRALARLRQADLVFGNLEGPLTRGGAPADKLMVMRMEPERVADLQALGFRAMSVANNHALDYGSDAFLESLALLRAHGILPVGGGRDLDEAWAPAMVEVGGWRVAFLAAASTLPPGFAAAEGRPGIAPIRVTECYEAVPSLSLEQPGTSPFVHTRAWSEDVEAAQAAVRQARARADFLIVSIHWGVPPFYRAPHQGDLAEYQSPLGQALIDAGADLVVGHHPHSLQGIQICHGRPIFHSLGNFIFDFYADCGSTVLARHAPYVAEGEAGREWSESVIVEVVLDRDRVRYELWLVWLDRAGWPHLLDGEEAAAVIGRLAELSRPLGGRLTFADDHGRLLMEPTELPCPAGHDEG